MKMQVVTIYLVFLSKQETTLTVVRHLRAWPPSLLVNQEVRYREAELQNAFTRSPVTSWPCYCYLVSRLLWQQWLPLLEFGWLDLLDGFPCWISVGMTRRGLFNNRHPLQHCCPVGRKTILTLYWPMVTGWSILNYLDSSLRVHVRATGVPLILKITECRFIHSDINRKNMPGK